MQTATLRVPDVLNGIAPHGEGVYTLVTDAPLADQYVLDMGAIGFVRPYGVVALVSAARCLSKRSGRAVCLSNIPSEVHSYLHRMNLFQVGGAWLRCSDHLDDEWLRSDYTANLLELTTIGRTDDVETAVARARRIFSQWLAIPNLGELCIVLSELCANIYQHSGDPFGCVLIQKYGPSRGRVTVDLAVGDLGCGIRQSLSRRHGAIAQGTIGYLREALSGKSARRSGRGGLGLRRVEQVVASSGGYLWLRSEDAGILSRGPSRTIDNVSLVTIPGTQVAVELNSPA